MKVAIKELTDQDIEKRQHFQMHFHKDFFILITISSHYFCEGPVDNKSAFIQVMAGHQTSEKPLPQTMLIKVFDIKFSDKS